MDVLSTANDFGHTFLCCEPCAKRKWCRQVVLVVTFVLMTFDMVTDWVNWKQWADIGGYDRHHFVYIFQTSFLCVAGVGTLLWLFETLIIVVKLHWIRKKRDMEKIEKCIYRLGVLILILTGLLEDLPVVLLVFYTVAMPICNSPARQEIGSGLTMATVISSMMNSLWTMIILYCELCGCKKIFEKVCGCCFKKNKATEGKEEERNSYRCSKSCCVKPCDGSPSKQCCKNILEKFGKIVLLGFIFLLFSGNTFLGILTAGHITGSVNLETFGIGWELYFRPHVAAGFLGPGLDSKPDEAMFINVAMGLPTAHQVVLYDEHGFIKQRSTWARQIINRLYVGQLEELSHLKEGTLAKAIPCSRVFPFLDKIDESLFIWEEGTVPLNTDFYDCKFIFTFRYYPYDNDWNPFKRLFNNLYNDITIEYGIHIKNKDICPSGIKSLPIEQVLNSHVENDLIKYTCDSACGKDANICHNTYNRRFRHSWGYTFGNVDFQNYIYFSINDRKIPDSCAFSTHFNMSMKFCDEQWAAVETIKVPIDIQHDYVQFLTIPELYKQHEVHGWPVPRYYCNNLWNNSIGCCY